MRRRSGLKIGAALVSIGLIAAACSDKKDEAVAPATSGATAETTAESTAPSTGETTAETTGETTAETTGETTAETTAETVAPPPDVVTGGTLIVSGEAEVASAWTPAAMQCDSYCQQRARSFYDPVAALGADREVHPYLAETITPNDDFTEWTIKIREGITFHDGTPLNAAAVIKNLQLTGTGLLIGKALVDVAKVPGPDGNPQLKIEQTDDLTFTIFTGKNGDPAAPLPWPGFDAYLAGQWGLIASPTWLDAVAAGTAEASAPIGSGSFIVESYAPADKLVVKKNPDYWQTDANGVQLPYLDGIEFRVIEDSEIAADALRSGDIDIFSTSSAYVISDFREDADAFPMTEQTEFTETNYILINLTATGPLQDARVRCALSKAINRDELNEAISAGILTTANGLFSPGQQGYLEDNGFDKAQDIEGAQALIDEYVAETGEDVTVNYGTTTTQLNQQTADLLQGYWAEIGVTMEYQQVPQDSFITDALLGNPNFFAFGWRNHAGTKIDSQYFWWHSSAAVNPGEGLSLNFGRIRDDIVDENLEIARSSSDPAEAQAAAEEVNRQMAKECYQIPTSWTLWGTPHLPKLQGLAQTILPDGTPALDGAGFSGQFWVTGLWLDS